MRRYVIPALVVCAAGALIGLLAFGVARQGTDTSIDAAVAKGHRPMAPSASVALPVLNVFASWCDPCKAEAPVLEQAQRELAKKNGTVLGVTYLDNSSDSEQFVKKEHITYPVIRDVNSNFVRSFGTTGVPETFVIDRNGRIAALRRFQLNGTWLEQTLPKILAERS
jgi:cytochrome c biogenesis protein CcmG/thiol:disulfide interchange protein DsbE